MGIKNSQMCMVYGNVFHYMLKGIVFLSILLSSFIIINSVFAAKLFISTSSIDFGDVGVGHRVIYTGLMVCQDDADSSSGGNCEIDDHFFADYNDDIFTFNGVISGTIIPVNSSKEFTVTFQPTSIITYSNKLIITYHASGEPGQVLEIELGGTGVAFYLEPDSLNFNDVIIGNSSSRSIILYNDGGASVTIYDVHSSNPDVFSIDGLGNGVIIPAHSYRSFDIIFTPNAEQEYDEKVVVEDVNHVKTEIVVTGSGVQGGGTTGNSTSASVTLYFSPSLLSFGSVNIGQTKTLPVYFYNDSGQSVTISDIEKQLDNGAFSYSGISEGDTIAPYATRQVDISFHPSMAVVYNGNLVVKLNDASSSEIELSLTGLGFQSMVHVNPESLNYGEIVPGSKRTMKVTIYNDYEDTTLVMAGNDWPFTMVSMPPDADSPPEFEALEDDWIAIAPKSSITLVLQMTVPENAVSGNYEARIDFILTDPYDARMATLSVPVFYSVHDKSPATVVCTPSTLDFGNIPLNTKKILAIDCVNNGEETALVVAELFNSARDNFSVSPYSYIQGVSSANTNNNTNNSTNTQGEGSGTINNSNVDTSTVSASEIPGHRSRKLIIECTPKSVGTITATVMLVITGDEQKAFQTVEISLTALGLSTTSDGTPKYTYYLDSTLVDGDFMISAGRGEIWVTDISGTGFVVDRQHFVEPGSPYTFKPLLERDPSDTIFHQGNGSGHYIYATILDQQMYRSFAASQMMVMDIDFNTLYDAFFMGHLNYPGVWMQNQIPFIGLNINGHKAVYVTREDVASNIFTSFLSMRWNDAPEGIDSGDIYLTLTNYDNSKQYCYDVDTGFFRWCSPVMSSAPDIPVGIDIEDFQISFTMPDDSDGLWILSFALTTDDGAVFYDKAAIVIERLTNGTVFEVY